MAQASAEKLEHTGPAEKERVASVPQREQLARTPEPPLPKGKGTELSVQSTRSSGGRKSRWARERGIRAKAWSGKGGLHRERRQIPRRKGRASRKSLSRTSRRKHERVSGRKSSPGRSAVLASLLVWPNLRWKRRFGYEEPAHKTKDRNESG